ncbi:MAG: NHLP family bacteriocin export ABC transporter peptidase/permease/ATPase subunit [Lachnospiraceae bacterium]|nr:NHLP family bacteriocin export ABC transporter peptidase/permease/ATPase subunit [Lachnospiraceae bacterium]
MKEQKKKVKAPVIMQMEALECGAASLAMVLAYYKKWVPLEQVREDCGVSRDGSNAANIIKAAKAYGLEAKAWRCSVDALKGGEIFEKMHFPIIIHWNFNHFVVLCGFTKKEALINDPARGMVKVDMDEFKGAFTGICLDFTPGPDFEPGGKRESVLEFARRQLKGSKLMIFFVMLTTVLTSFIGIVTPVFSRVFADRLLVGKDAAWIPAFFGALGVIALTRLLLGILNEVYLYKIKGKMSIVSNASFLWHILKLPMGFFSQRMAGDLAGRQRLNDSIAETLIAKMAPAVINILLLVFYLAVMLTYSPLLTAVGLGAVFFNLVIGKILSDQRVQTTRLRMRDEGKLNSATVSGIDMIETIKSSGAENGFFERWAGYQASVSNARMQEIKSQRFLLGLPELVQQLSDVLILVLGVYLIMEGQLTAGMLLTFQSFMLQFMAPVEGLIDAGQSIQEMRTSMERIEDVMRYEEDDSYGKTALEHTEVYEKLSGQIELKHVTFGYSKMAPPLLKNFSMTIHPGDKVAFVGASGCGKSTIAKLICGLYVPWEGEILFDGKPINGIPEEVFHGSVAMVDQDITLFGDSVSENIRMWDQTVEDYEIILAARDAQIHEDIMMRPKGYRYEMQEGGRDFSGGQRQRFEIARVLAQDPTIAILDEATSALDAKTEFSVMNAIRERGVTSIVVAHRLSTIRDCTEIVVLKNGEVAERGTHEELYRKGGVYARLITTE